MRTSNIQHRTSNAEVKIGGLSFTAYCRSASAAIFPPMPFTYEPTFQTAPDSTAYRLLTTEGVGTIEAAGRTFLTVSPAALTLLARQAFMDVSFYLRPAHLTQLCEELKDPEASDNDRFVLYTHLQNAVVAAHG